jgi:hypothetical protein
MTGEQLTIEPVVQNAERETVDLLTPILVPGHELGAPKLALLVPRTVINVDDAEVVAKRLGPKLLLRQLVVKSTKVRPGALVDTDCGLHNMLKIPLTKRLVILDLYSRDLRLGLQLGLGLGLGLWNGGLLRSLLRLRNGRSSRLAVLLGSLDEGAIVRDIGVGFRATGRQRMSAEMIATSQAHGSADDAKQ